MNFFEKHTVAFEPISTRESQDELILAIQNAHLDSDDAWELGSGIDPAQLVQTWEAIVDDVRADPEWLGQGID